MIICLNHRCDDVTQRCSTAAYNLTARADKTAPASDLSTGARSCNIRSFLHKRARTSERLSLSAWAIRLYISRRR